MPGVAVHQLFGDNTIKTYDYDNGKSYVKKCISEYEEVYNFGLQGPDFFFYFFLSPIFFSKNIGSVMHTVNTKKFKENSLYMIYGIADEEKRKIAVSYISGYMGHCTLDEICHPYIYAVTGYDKDDKDCFARHVELETELDSIYVKKFKGCRLYDFIPHDMVSMDRSEINVVADVFSKSFNNSYYGINIRKKMMVFIINVYISLVNVFRDRHGIKKHMVEFFEKNLIRRKIISPLFVVENRKKCYDDVLNIRRADWYSPWKPDEKRNESFCELFDSAVKKYDCILRELDEYFKTGDIDRLHLSVENKSLHSGLDCSVPS